MNRFVVTGTPRSATTFFCSVLKKHYGISMVPEAKGNKSPLDTELFPPHDDRIKPSKFTGVNNYDNNRTIEVWSDKVTNEHTKFVGFKTFPMYHYDNLKMIEYNDLSVILLMRKNLWKVLASLITAMNSTTWNKSGLVVKKYTYSYDPFTYYMLRNTVDHIFNFLWYFENKLSRHDNYVTTVYFEDLIKRNYTNNDLNKYFNSTIVFNADYDDSSKPSDYISNISEIKKQYVDPLLDSKLVEGLPSWAIDSLHNDCV